MSCFCLVLVLGKRRRKLKKKKKRATSSLTSLPFFSWQEMNISAQVLLKGIRLTGAVTLNRWVTLLKKCSSERIIVGSKGHSLSYQAFFFQNVSDLGHQLCWQFSGESSFFIVIIHSFIHSFLRDWDPAKTPALNFIFNYLKTNFLSQ